MIVVFKKEGEEINNIYLDSLLKAGFDEWVSATFTKDGCVTIQMTDPDEKMDLESLSEIQETYKDTDLYLAFGKGKDFHRDCIQPFSILERTPSKETTLAAFLYGPFPEFTKDGSQLLPAFFALNEYIGPKLRKVSRALVCEPHYSGTDLTRLWDAINDTSDRRDFKNFIKDHEDNGMILLLADGKHQVINSKPLYAFSWGWTTNPLDYSEVDYPAKEEIEEKPKSGLLSKLKKDNTLLTQHGTGLDKVKEENKQEKKEEPVIETTNETIVNDYLGSFQIQRRLSDGFMRPHPDVKGRNHQKNIYKAICATVPKDFRTDLPFVKPTTNKATSTFKTLVKDLKDIGAALKDKESSTKDVSVHSIPTVKQNEEKQKEEKEPEKEKEETVPWEPKPEDKIPLLPAKELESLDNFINSGMTQKYLDTHSIVIPDPSSAQAREKMLPSLCTKLNIDLLRTLKWPFEFVIQLGEQNPKAVAMLWNDLRYEFMKRLTPDERIALNPSTDTTEIKKGLLGGVLKKRA